MGIYLVFPDNHHPHRQFMEHVSSRQRVAASDEKEDVQHGHPKFSREYREQDSQFNYDDAIVSE